MAILFYSGERVMLNILVTVRHLTLSKQGVNLTPCGHAEYAVHLQALQFQFSA